MTAAVSVSEERPPLEQGEIDALREMAGTVAVKGYLLLQLLDEIERHRRAESAWMPIATAPMDGTDILVAYQNCDSWFYHRAFWLDGEGVDEDDIGWWSYMLTEVTRTKLDGCCEPTHWMPLPAAPTVTP